MKANTARRYRLYLTADQVERLTGWGHTCRALWNVALEQRKWLYSQRRITTWSSTQCAELTELRAELDWVADLPAQAGQQVLRHLDQAYRNWWNPNHPAQAPTHRRRGSPLTVSFPGQKVSVRRLNRRWGAVCVPKLGELQFRWSRSLSGTVRSATISRDGLGWHVAFGIASGIVTPVHPHPERTVGLDRGVVVAVADSEGGLHTRTFRSDGESARKLALERRASRQDLRRRRTATPTSDRARQTRMSLARIETRISCRRNDFAHQLTHQIAETYGLIGIEDLRIASMTRSAHGTVENPGRNVSAKAGLNRSILDKGWGGFRTALENQARKTGSRVVAVPAAFTSQRCAACGHVASGNRESQAVFRCLTCGHIAHADVNAAINIRDLAVTTAGRAGLGRISHPNRAAASTTGRRDMNAPWNLPFERWRGRQAINTGISERLTR